MKRLIDLIITLTMAFIGFPVLLVVAILVFLRLGKPVIFTQDRPGKNGKVFKLTKFRSMTSKTDEHGVLLSDEKRLSAFGKFLRTTSLDELPTLWNVLRGDMSIVGPRPLLVDYLPLYSSEQSRRHDVKPGITGWAQVNGRNSISWEDKFKLDIWYVENKSTRIDLKIMYLTVMKVLAQKDINQSKEITMAPFSGSKVRKKQVE